MKREEKREKGRKVKEKRRKGIWLSIQEAKARERIQVSLGYTAKAPFYLRK